MKVFIRKMKVFKKKYKKNLVERNKSITFATLLKR